jgi:hypothetical protein
MTSPGLAALASACDKNKEGREEEEEEQVGAPTVPSAFIANSGE